MRIDKAFSGTLKNRFTCIPIAFSLSLFFSLGSLFFFSFKMFGSIQDGNKIHTHAVTTNKEAFTKKKIKRHLKNRKIKQQKKTYSHINEIINSVAWIPLCFNIMSFWRKLNLVKMNFLATPLLKQNLKLITHLRT